MLDMPFNRPRGAAGIDMLARGGIDMPGAQTRHKQHSGNARSMVWMDRTPMGICQLFVLLSWFEIVFSQYFIQTLW